MTIVWGDEEGRLLREKSPGLKPFDFIGSLPRPKGRCYSEGLHPVASVPKGRRYSEGLRPFHLTAPEGRSYSKGLRPWSAALFAVPRRIT